MLDHVSITAYGATQPLSELGAVTVRDASTLVVNLYDASLAPAAEAALRASPLGLQPRAEASVVVVSVPAPSAKARDSLAKLAAAAGEAARTSGRRVRHEALDELRKATAGAAADEAKRAEKQLQAATEAFNKAVAAAIAAKEKEIKT